MKEQNYLDYKKKLNSNPKFKSEERVKYLKFLSDEKLLSEIKKDLDRHLRCHGVLVDLNSNWELFSGTISKSGYHQVSWFDKNARFVSNSSQSSMTNSVSIKDISESEFIKQIRTKLKEAA